MIEMVKNFWMDDDGQDIAEYALMLAVILVLVVAIVKVIGKNASSTFSAAASAIDPANTGS